MYYIYEIPGVKVGCTQDMERRQKEQLSKGKMILLEECLTIEEATRRERELQLEKGYKVDSKPYYKTVAMARLTKTPEAMSKRNGSYKYPENGKIKKGTKIYQYSKQGNFIKEWPYIRKAADTLDVHFCSISNALRGISKTSGGYIWKYAE